MIARNELTSITVLVSYLNGTEIANQIVPFKVFKENRLYRAIPLINNEERKLTELPEEIYFEFNNHTIIPGKAITDKGLEVLENIVQELKMQKISL